MSSHQTTINYIIEQIYKAGSITFRKMFGEYAIYCNGKVVAFVCDDQLFVKPTENGRKYIENLEEISPFPGIRPHFYISGDKWEDSEWLTGLIKVTEEELPFPKPKKKKG